MDYQDFEKDLLALYKEECNKLQDTFQNCYTHNKDLDFYKGELILKQFIHGGTIEKILSNVIHIRPRAEIEGDKCVLERLFKGLNCYEIISRDPWTSVQYTVVRNVIGEYLFCYALNHKGTVHSKECVCSKCNGTFVDYKPKPEPETKEYNDEIEELITKCLKEKFPDEEKIEYKKIVDLFLYKHSSIFERYKSTNTLYRSARRNYLDYIRHWLDSEKITEKQRLMCEEVIQILADEFLKRKF